MKAPAAAVPATLQPHWTRTSLGKFGDPYSVAVDPACIGNCDVYVADPGDKAIWRVTPEGHKHRFGDFSGAGPGFDPQGVALVAGGSVVWVADKRPLGQTSKIWHVINGGVAQETNGFSFPAHTYARGIAVGPFGEVYVAAATFTSFTHRSYILCQGQTGKCRVDSGSSFGDVYGVAVDHKQTLYAADAGRTTVWWSPYFDRSFTRLFDNVDPYGVAVSWEGLRIAYADHASKHVWLFHGGVLHDLGAFADPYGVAVDQSGTVYVADAGAKEVFKLTP